MSLTSHPSEIHLPRITITYCTQCKWLLRAAYFAQELLSTFSTSIGEIALIPSTGGIFSVYLTYVPESAEQGAEGKQEAREERVLLWDRKAEGGFPETKILKQKVRDCIDPRRGLGHSDTPSKKKEKEIENGQMAEEDRLVGSQTTVEKEEDCEDCK